jgi:hypothetical protein
VLRHHVVGGRPGRTGPQQRRHRGHAPRPRGTGTTVVVTTIDVTIDIVSKFDVSTDVISTTTVTASRTALTPPAYSTRRSRAARVALTTLSARVEAPAQLAALLFCTALATAVVPSAATNLTPL